LSKKSHVNLDNLCKLLAKKTLFFVVNVKKEKKHVSQKALFLASNFVFLQNPNGKPIFHAKTLRARSM
jgi:hypothetical protein